MRYRYIYKYKTGLTKVKTRLAIALTAIGLGVGGVIGSVAIFGAAHAAPTFSISPWTFIGAAGDCGTDYPAGTGPVVSKWDNTIGNPAPSLRLEKNVDTTDCSSAGATINGVSGITLNELNFDVKGYCGAGAPRFNVTTTDSVTHFFGCVYGIHTPSTTDATWTHVEFSPSDGASPVTSGEVVQSIEIVMDEQGQTNLDNISINGQVIGGPTLNDCKNSGWMNLTDQNNSPFKNQGQCVSWFNHNDGVGKDDTHAKAVR